MARRRLLTDVQWSALLSPPTDEREIIRHYTLSDEDLAAAASKRGDHNRIGFALRSGLRPRALARRQNCEL